MCLRRIEDGSATAPLEVYIEEESQAALWETEPREIGEAINLAHETFEAVERDSPLPERFPKELLSQYVDWGKSLAEDEEVEIQPVGKQPTRFTQITRNRLSGFCEVPNTDYVDVTGEVLETDVKQRKFQLWLDGKTHVSATFSDSQEGDVTTALRDHKSIRVRVKGHAEMSPQGKLLRITEVDQLVFGPVGEAPYDQTALPIEEVLAGLAREVPRAEWDKLPTDLTDNLDHYLYGSSKR